MPMFITRIRWAPLALSVFFAMLTGRVLFDDVINSPLPWLQATTTTHWLTLGGMVAAIASGHFAETEFRRGWGWNLLSGAALTVLFLVATVFIVVSGGSRTAEQAAVKVVHVTDIATKRAEAKTALEKAEAAHTAAVDYWVTQRDAATAECKSGEGTKCRGARSNETAALTAADKAAKRAGELRTAFDDLKPAPPANAGYAHFAKIVSAFTGANIEATTAKIVLAMPFVAVILNEIATIIFGRMGLAGISVPAPVVSAPVPAPHGGNVVDHPVVRALRQGAANSNDELAARLGETKGEASKKRGEVRDLLIEQKIGRRTVIDLKPEVRRALG